MLRLGVLYGTRWPINVCRSESMNGTRWNACNHCLARAPTYRYVYPTYKSICHYVNDMAGYIYVIRIVIREGFFLIPQNIVIAKMDRRSKTFIIYSKRINITNYYIFGALTVYLRKGKTQKMENANASTLSARWFHLEPFLCQK